MSMPAAGRHYFDNAASSLLTPVARAAMGEYDESPWAGANPNSLHADGRAAFACLERARSSLARSLGAGRPSEVYFTSGGTESNNLAVTGLARAAFEASHGSRRRVLVSALEHESVRELGGPVRRAGLEFEVVPATRDGIVDLAALVDMLSDDVALVSVMAANNEVGTVQPLEDVVRLAHGVGALVHSDAVQAFGHMGLSVRALGLDAASVTAHKLGGPVGVGALYVRAHTRIAPLFMGGGQESGVRSGTVDVRGAHVFASVAADAVSRLPESAAAMAKVAHAVLEGACEGPDAVARPTVAGPRDARFLPGTLSLIVPGHHSKELIVALDDRGFAVSGGSACASGSLDPSHVLGAMGIPRDEALCALRVSFDERVSVDEGRALAQALREVCGR